MVPQIDTAGNQFFFDHDTCSSSHYRRGRITGYRDGRLLVALTSQSQVVWRLC